LNYLIIFVAIFLAFFSTFQSRDIWFKFIDFSIKIEKPIDIDFIQEIINGLTNGLIPRIHLAKTAQTYALKNTQQSALAGLSIIEALEKDLANNLVAKQFAQVWQICEENGAPLTSALNQLAQQLRTESELKDELTGAMAAAKLSAWVLAGLPIFGIFLASFLGVNSLNWLRISHIGNINLVLAVFLETIGIYWVVKINKKIAGLI
jgi:hypothetical protein